MQLKSIFICFKVTGDKRLSLSASQAADYSTSLLTSPSKIHQFFSVWYQDCFLTPKDIYKSSLNRLKMECMQIFGS